MDARRAIEATFRIEYPRLVAGLVRITREVGMAEELAQDALVAALETWPDAGVPDNPGAWLMTTARNRALDRVRRSRRFPQDALVVEPAAPAQPMDLLSLMLVACHPVLPTDQRVALTLRLLGGLTTEEIARAFVVPEATIAQRITRAKQAVAGEVFEVPRGEALAERLGAVLEVLYLIFNEGYSATTGDDWTRPELCADALRLGRTLATLVPDEPEVHGLLALMELQASRLRARTAADGTPILLADQDRRRWDLSAIQRGRAALARAQHLGGGVYTLQAAIAACHTEAQTDWIKIAALYAALQQRAPSPIVELNRAVAVAQAFGPAAGLALLDDAASVRALAGYHLLPAVRGDLLAKLGRFTEARAAFLRAAELARNAKDKELLLARAAGCDKVGG